MRRVLLVLLVVSVLVLPLLLVLGHERVPEKPRVALIEITGTIADSSSASPWSDLSTGAREVIEHLRTAQEDPRFAAVVVRINSGGGSPAAAQEIYQAIRQVRANNKPVVASMGDVAASAAYYIASAADKVVANPSTLTGSIGAIMEVFIVEDLMERFGVEAETIVSGRYKDAGSPYRPLSPEERAHFQELVNDVLDQFISDVAQGRGMDVETVRAVADGRVFSGRQALALGLVDHLGGLEDAVSIAAELAGIEERPVVVPLRRERSWYDRLLGAVATALVRAGLGHPAGLWSIESVANGVPAGNLTPYIPPWGYRLRY